MGFSQYQALKSASSVWHKKQARMIPLMYLSGLNMMAPILNKEQLAISFIISIFSN